MSQNDKLVSTPFLSLQAFFTDTYMHEHPDDLESIEVLKHLIALQVNRNSLLAVEPVLRHTVPAIRTEAPSSSPIRSLSWLMGSESTERNPLSS